ncbi:MAG: hypothetical protein AMS17_18920 [Spirochaetes bacterium DG_61]|nr:MAG: hypothetical protein AMS17_18920 [Spirochaetes bacterium DG_61]
MKRYYHKLKKTGFFRISFILIPIVFIFLSSCVPRWNLYDLHRLKDDSEDTTPSADFAVFTVEATNCTTVKVVFTEEVEQTSSEIASNYSIIGLSVSSVERDTADFSIVYLTTSDQQNINYTIMVNGVLDIHSNPLGSQNSKVFRGDAAPYLQNVGSYYSDPDYFVTVFYSEEVETVSSEDVANYSITGLSIFSATQDTANRAKVTLVTDAQTNGASYTLTVNNVLDLTGNTITTPCSMDFTGTGVVDTTPPSVISAVLIDENTAEVQFSEPIDQVTSEIAANYSIEDSGGNPVVVISATRQSDNSKVWLDISGLFSKGLYNLIVSTNVKDVNGNSVESTGNTAFFAGQGTYILSASAVSYTSIKVVFSDPVEQSAAETASNYSIPGLIISSAVQDGADFTVVWLSTSAHEDINYTLTVTVFIDQDSEIFAGDVAPYLESVCSSSNTEVVVYFSEAVDTTSAEDKANYAISSGLMVYSATRDTVEPSRVILQTDSQVGGTTYTLSITNVKDLNENPIQSPSSMGFIGTGVIDSTNPMVLSAYLIDSNTVCVQFSEPMDQPSSENNNYYTIRDNTGNKPSVTAATRQSDLSKVWLDITSSFSSSLYWITVDTGVCDLNLNPLMGPPVNTISFTGEGIIPTSFTDGAVVVDPINEGPNSYSLLLEYKGRIYIGPADADNRVFRMKPDGSDPELVSFTFHVGGTYTNTLDPGPDGEDGIDYIAGGQINGTEYLFIGPSNLGGLDYIYFTTGSGKVLDFSPMDLSEVTGGNTEGVSAMIFYSDNLYVGLPDTGGNRPYLYRIIDIKENPAKDVDVINLEGGDMTRIGANGSPEKNEAGKVSIDSFGIFNGMLYLANGGHNIVNGDGGILRSTTSIPLNYKDYPGDWADVTPITSMEWNNSPLNDRFSLELSKVSKLIPAEKAIPQMALFNNKLYIIRNTIGSPNGPQLWKYDGVNWSLVANNGMGITDMGNINNLYISLLVVNGDRLYIGYDNDTDGIQLWRTVAGITDPEFDSDFEPVLTDGLGDPANNQRIYHGLSITDGGTDYLWLLCGKDGGNVRVYRTKN